MTLKSFELFDSTRHTLSDTAVVLAFDPKGMVALSDPARPYGAEMRALLGGENDIGYGETLLLTPDDVSLCVGNAKKRLSESFIPLIYDHGWSARGTEGAGAVVDCFERNGDLWLSVDFADDDIFKGACKPGKKWMGRSLGFGAWIDAERKVRPADPKECSLTNLPRMKGLGPVVGLSAIRRFFDLARPVPSLATVPSAPPEGAQNAAAGGEGLSLSRIPSPVPASNRKEEHMKVTPENLKLLGLAPDASEDDFNARLAERLAPKPAPVPAPEATPAPVPAPEATPPPVPTVSLADVQKIVADATAAVFKDLADTNAKAIAEATAAAEKKARVDGVLAEAVRLGKMRKADLDLYRPSVEANPEAFAARLSTMPNVAPVERFYQAGGTGAPGGEFHGYDTPAAYGRAIGDTVAALGCSVSAAIDIVNAGGVAAGEEN